MARVRARPARRYYFFKEVSARAVGNDALADAWREKRIAEHGTVLPAAFPWRAASLSVGVLAIEDLDGASARAIECLGLQARKATDIFNRIEGITNVTTLYFQLSPRAGEAYDQDEVTLFASAARGASFSSDAYEAGDRGTLRLTQTVAAISGAGAEQQVQIETRRDASDSWRTVDAFPVVTATGTYRKTFTGLDRQARAVVTIAGSTPSVTSSLTGEAV